jgi:lysophospholipase
VLIYHAGLSGGLWLLLLIAGNNYPIISSLRDDLWESVLQDSLLLPDELLVADAYAQVSADIVSKEAAGFNITVADL